MVTPSCRGFISVDDGDDADDAEDEADEIVMDSFEEADALVSCSSCDSHYIVHIISRMCAPPAAGATLNR